MSRRTVTSPLHRCAGALLRTSPGRALLARAPALRGVGIALLWHRIRPRGARDTDVIPTVPRDLLRRQLEALLEVGEIVPLSELERHDPQDGPRFALTFDDDDAGHAQHALPVLTELGLPATFFLSGRWLHGLGPYWWEVLESSARRDGVDELARQLGHPGCSTIELAAAIEGTPQAARLATIGNQGSRDGLMSGQEAQALAEHGMEIGFHTVDHPVLTELDPQATRDAVSRGRRALATQLGTDIERFAYPHGRADARTRTAVRHAGFVSAWTTSHRPVRTSDDVTARGRWEPGPREPESLLVGAVRRLLLRMETRSIR